MMGSISGDDVEIIDPETYRAGGEKEFNHEALIMQAFRNCVEAGSHEMRPGAMNQKTDNKGNTILTYIEDTRKKFIESVKSLRGVIISDVDEEAKKNIKRLSDSLVKKHKELLDIQQRWWNSLNPSQQKNAADQGHLIMQGVLNKNLPWFEMYVEEELNNHRLLMEEFTKLTARLGFYQETEIIG